MSGSKTIFWTGAVRERPAIATDSIALLQKVIKAPVDKTSLATRLVQHLLPADPTLFRTVWEGAEMLRLGCELRMERNGLAWQKQTWRAETGTRSITEASGDLRETLDRVLSRTIEGAIRISADISGGLDSTSLAYLLTGQGKRYLAVRTDSVNSVNDEGEWARKAAQELGVELSEVGRLADTSSAFSLDRSGKLEMLAEGPFFWEGTKGHLESILPRLIAYGSTVHITGLGGDELFDSHLSGMLSTIWRQYGTSAWPSVRAAQLHDRIPFREVLRSLRRPKPFVDELRVVAQLVRGEAAREVRDRMVWHPFANLPTWLSEEARELIATQLERSAEMGLEPLGHNPAAHQVAQSIAYEGVILRQVNEYYAQTGIRWEAPFADKSVVEIALSVDLRERIKPGTFKPLLATTMQPTMPLEFFQRELKGDYSSDIYAEYARKRTQLLEFFDAPLVHEIGLVDVNLLRADLDSPSALDPALMAIHNVTTTERWLRGLSEAQSGEEKQVGPPHHREPKL
ncbi:hypothetical protein AUL38_14070 [Leucobacter sp. G161]|nr:hypothetical protein AUL38_14070 [Leucobacter sp. G161]